MLFSFRMLILSVVLANNLIYLLTLTLFPDIFQCSTLVCSIRIFVHNFTARKFYFSGSFIVGSQSRISHFRASTSYQSGSKHTQQSSKWNCWNYQCKPQGLQSTWSGTPGMYQKNNSFLFSVYDRLFALNMYTY